MRGMEKERRVKEHRLIKFQGMGGGGDDVHVQK